MADDVLFNAVRGISDLITIHGLINLDFADVRTIMNEMGVALMGTGTGTGDERAVEAARAAISSPLLEDLSIEGAHGVLINITGGEDLSLFEVNEASTLIQEAAHEDANIIFGAVVDDSMTAGEMRITVIATGLDHARVRRTPDNELGTDSHATVTPLRPEPSVSYSPAASPPPAAARDTSPTQAEFRDLSPSQTPLKPEPERGTGEDWVSPFDDELDIPTFLRRSAD
jgi:cell division protein FtsZ